MELKFIITVSLIVILFVGFVNFGYLTYTINADATNQVGKNLINSHKMLFYTNFALNVTALLLGIGIFLKR